VAVDLYTSRWANRELARLACRPVGISRGVPRFPLPYKYRQVRELAPDNATWVEKDLEAFRLSYERQLGEIGADAILARLERESGGLPAVLLCFEDVTQPGAWCHRTMLREWLTKRGVRISELEPGDLPERGDTPQPSLFRDLPRGERA
jgi:hypothetical protein